MESLVSPAWLAANLDTPDLRILDATAFALDLGRDPHREYLERHIVGARFLDLAGLADPDSDLPGMLPSAARFAERVGALGVGTGDRVLLYDNSPHRTSARAWWMFRTFGARGVAILDGGLPAWIAAGGATASGDEPAPAPASFTARKHEAAVRDLAQIEANIASGAEQLLDARGAARFAGTEADPHGAAPGHIPRSRNLPYTRLLDAAGRFKDKAVLLAEFDAAGIDLAMPLVTTCGSGVTASVLLFGAHLLGKDDAALYDGSWSEYGTNPATAKARGPA